MVSPRSHKPILLVGTFLSSQVGTRGVSEELAFRLQERGWIVYTTSAKLGRWSRLLDMVSSVWRMRKNYAVANVEVYSGYAFIWAEIITCLLSALHKPFILTLHGGGLASFLQKWPGRVKRVLNAASYVTTPSFYLHKNFIPFRSDILYLPNAIDINVYPFRQRCQPQAYLVWLRAFHKIYQPEIAVQALALLKSSFPAASLTMIGPDKKDGSKQEVDRIADQSGLQTSLRLVGPVQKKDVPSFINKGEIFINTTTYESFGISVMEAAACGLPIVTTNVGELPYLWEHNKNALLVPPNNAEAVANAIRRILIEPGLAEKLSINAREKAEEYDWSVILPKWEALFSTLSSQSR